MKNLRTFLINTALLIIAIVLSCLLFPIGWLFSLFTLRLSFSKFNSYIITIALSIDQLGNVILAPLFNKILKKKEGYLFGDEDDTISYVLGINKSTETLNPLGLVLANLLDAIDKNHCQKAVKLAWKKGRKYCVDKKPYDV